VRTAILEFFEDREEITEATTMITQEEGEMIVLGITARICRAATAGDLIARIARCGTALQGAFPQLKWIFSEPVADAKAKER